MHRSTGMSRIVDEFFDATVGVVEQVMHRVCDVPREIRHEIDELDCDGRWDDCRCDDDPWGRDRPDRCRCDSCRHDWHDREEHHHGDGEEGHRHDDGEEGNHQDDKPRKPRSKKAS